MGQDDAVDTIAGLLTGRGPITFGATDVTGAEPARSCAGLALVPERRRIFKDLTVDENLQLAGITAPASGAGAWRRPPRFPCATSVDASAGFLSGGEAQQLAVARALMSDPATAARRADARSGAGVVDAIFDLLVTFRRPHRAGRRAERPPDAARRPWLRAAHRPGRGRGSGRGAGRARGPLRRFVGDAGTTLMQTLVDGLGRGSTYALLALGISLIFGVMHLVNFAHAELITVGAYVAYGLSTRGFSWWVLAPDRRAGDPRLGHHRSGSPSAGFATPVRSRCCSRRSQSSACRTRCGRSSCRRRRRRSPVPSWAFNTFELGDMRFEVMDLVTIAVTAVVLTLTAFVFRRTLFGIAVRAASEDFDAARLMGVRANRVISGAFAYAGFLAGVAAVLILMRSPTRRADAGRRLAAQGRRRRRHRRTRQLHRRGRRRARARARRGALRSYLPDGALEAHHRRVRVRARRRCCSSCGRRACSTCAPRSGV